MLGVTTPDRRTVLITGFEPFHGAHRNPSIDAVRAVARDWDRTERLVARELPVAFGRAGALLDALLEEHLPDVVVGVGLAAGRTRLGLERVAVNLTDARIPDNDGVQPGDGPVVPGGPVAHLTTVPVKVALGRLTAAGIPTELSMTAGTYVCNAVFYRAADHASRRPGVRAGFVHVPPGLAVDTLALAVRTVVDTALDVVADLPVAVGGTD